MASNSMTMGAEPETETFQAPARIAPAPSPVEPSLETVLAEVREAIPPLWPLRDFVAVNPFLGMAHLPFLEARRNLRRFRDAEMLMPAAYYRDLLAQGDLQSTDIEEALVECRRAYPDAFARMTAEQVLRTIGEQDLPANASEERCFFTAAEVIDLAQGSDWAGTIVEEVSRHCAAHYDEGQAVWPNPWKHLPLYEAWRATVQRERRLEKLGVEGFRSFAADLPDEPLEAIDLLLGRLEIRGAARRGFLLCQTYSVAGWASYVRYRVRAAERAGGDEEDLVGLLAVRLAYDAALAEKHAGPAERTALRKMGRGVKGPQGSETYAVGTLARYALQTASEIAYRRRLLSTLAPTGPGQAAATQRAAVQMVFCIDVRSEPMRRHLEACREGIRTFGFAGFFGVPFEYVPLGLDGGSAQCPVLLTPQRRVQEGVRGDEPLVDDAPRTRRLQVRAWRKAWKAFQTSAASCFSFVECFGPAYLLRLLADSLGWSRSDADGRFDGLPKDQHGRLGPKVHAHGECGWNVQERVDLAHGILRNLGLTTDFARLVVFCGHGSSTVNNPYRAGLDCGACGGHSGEVNARVAAALLNDPEVRSGLAARGLVVPEDVHFLAALHDTTTDAIRFLDVDEIPPTHAEDFRDLCRRTEEAALLVRTERTGRLGCTDPDDLLRRSRDWSEVRPEWGLAGNAAFIAAPRDRTSGMNLGGRTFLHSYDHRLDGDRRVLELILTAPVVVANWINLQYYASSVDGAAFGSGNKVLHNVVGRLGILEGNGGDLKTGLPFQSVHDGTRLQHQPLRLLVIVEAPRHAVAAILDRHEDVRRLVRHGWLSLVAIDQEAFYRHAEDGSWIRLTV